LGVRHLRSSFKILPRFPPGFVSAVSAGCVLCRSGHKNQKPGPSVGHHEGTDQAAPGFCVLSGGGMCPMCPLDVSAARPRPPVNPLKGHKSHQNSPGKVGQDPPTAFLCPLSEIDRPGKPERNLGPNRPASVAGLLCPLFLCPLFVPCGPSFVPSVCPLDVPDVPCAPPGPPARARPALAKLSHPGHIVARARKTALRGSVGQGFAENASRTGEASKGSVSVPW
jgi:hypothetical protein